MFAEDGDAAWRIPRRASRRASRPGLDDAGPGRAEVCQRVRKAGVSRASTSSSLAGRARGRHAGLTAGDDYLRKPFDNVELEARMRTGRRIVELEDELVNVRAALHEHQAKEQAHGRVIVPHSDRTPGRGGPAKR